MSRDLAEQSVHDLTPYRRLILISLEQAEQGVRDRAGIRRQIAHPEAEQRRREVQPLGDAWRFAQALRTACKNRTTCPASCPSTPGTRASTILTSLSSLGWSHSGRGSGAAAHR
jgi:hypothetical protein